MVKTVISSARRRFLALCAALGLKGLFRSTLSSAEESEDFTILGKDDSLHIGENKRELIRKAYRIGRDYEDRHGGCCRCTVGALQDALDFVPNDKDLLRAASCLDGGATPTKLANCGSFTGSGMIIGYLTGDDSYGDTGLSHSLIKKLHKRYEDVYGGVLCNDVRKAARGNCDEVVGLAAQWTTGIILDRFAEETGAG